MTNVYIGLDSGGTRTNVSILIAGSEQVLRNYQSAEVIAGTTPPKLYPQQLRLMLARAEGYIADARVTDAKIYLFLGAAGFAHSTRERLAEAFEEVLPAAFEGRLAVAGAANDGTSLLMGYGADAIVIAGTGSTVMVQDSDRKIHIAGGHDWVGSDHGSGFWIGLRGIRQASRDFESGAQTDLLDLFRETYSISGEDSRRFITKLRELAFSVHDCVLSIVHCCTGLLSQPGLPKKKNVSRNIPAVLDVACPSTGVAPQVLTTVVNDSERVMTLLIACESWSSTW